MSGVGVLLLCASIVASTMMWNPAAARAAMPCSWIKQNPDAWPFYKQKDPQTYKERCEFDDKDSWESWARTACENVPESEPQKYRDCLAERNEFRNEIKAEQRRQEADGLAKEKAERQAAIARQKATDVKRIANIKAKKWPADIEKAVIDKKIRLGMTDEQVRMAWGKPETVNRSVGSWGRHEQWVYGSTYLYFENDLLKSYQESR
jgi:hypothetical protein